jgi:transglutaminase-like putative cysteine protease
LLIRLGYDIEFYLPFPTPIVALLEVHPSRIPDLREPDQMKLDPEVPIERYVDSFGNHCSRFLGEAGTLRIYNSTLIEDSGEPDPQAPDARQHPVEELPAEVLPFLMGSRYCETDLLSQVASELFGQVTPGWARVQAVCDWVYSKVEFGYPYARATKTALDVYLERTGVCRDFQHLAITFCRCLNIPARYAAGYLGDIGIVIPPSPMDFSAWFEAYLDGRWWTFDARHNQPRIGRVVMATGRDATDIAITTAFGRAPLTRFFVVSDEVKAQTAA